MNKKEFLKLKHQEYEDINQISEQIRILACIMQYSGCNDAYANILACHNLIAIYSSWSDAYTKMQSKIRSIKECIRVVDRFYKQQKFWGPSSGPTFYLHGKSQIFYQEFEKKYKDKKWNDKKYLKNLFVFELFAYRYLRDLIYPKMIYWRGKSVFSI